MSVTTHLDSAHHSALLAFPTCQLLQTRLEFEREYKRRLATRDYLDTVNSYLAYDATWTLALALNRSLAALGDECGGVGVGESGESGVGECGSYCETMTQCTSDLSTRLFCLLHCNLQETNFLGVSVSLYIHATYFILLIVYVASLSWLESLSDQPYMFSS